MKHAYNPLRMHPAEVVTSAILGVVTLTLLAAVARGAALLDQAMLHAGLLLGYLILSTVLARRIQQRWTAPVRGLAVIVVMFTLYSTLGHVAFAAIPWNADPALEAADRILFLGHSPVLRFGSQPGPRTVEVLSFFYGAFIPYLYMSILLGLMARPPVEREQFVTAFAILYATSFLGYLFLPARGPIVALAPEFPVPLQGGTFHTMVVNAIDRLGGPHGAFPSLHVGATFMVIWFDLRQRNLLRGLIYVPLLLLIVAATIVLRYHWVVDLLAGALLALLANYLAPMLLAWRSRASVQARA